jgi:cation transport regulator ChaC
VPLYFAYGSNMDAAAMASRCPKSRPRGLARLPRRRFVIMEPGFASVAPDARTSVHGVLWDLALADVPALDRYEEVSRGLYKKTVLPVLRATGGSCGALVYIGGVAKESEPQQSYLEGIIAAARHWSLPESYIRYLESLLPVRKQGRP